MAEGKRTIIWLLQQECRTSSGSSMIEHAIATSTPSSIDGCTASCDAHQQTMIGTSLQTYLEAVCTFSNQLLHGVLQITTHITSHCILHQCLNQGICSCTCLQEVCKRHQHPHPHTAAACTYALPVCKACCPNVGKNTLCKGSTCHRQALFRTHELMQMILPQAHLRKHCYDFSFL